MAEPTPRLPNPSLGGFRFWNAWRRRVARVSRSIRYVGMLWYVGMLALILCAFSVVLYVTVSTGLTRDVDRALALQATGTAEAIFAFWRAERATLLGPGNWQAAPANTFQGAVNAGELPSLASRWAEKTGGLSTAERAIRLLDRSGRLLGESPSFTQAGFSSAPRTRAPVQRKPAAYETVPLPTGRMRLLTHPVRKGGSVLYRVQVAASLEPVERSLDRLRVWLIWLVPFTLVMTSAVGWFLASRTLHPVAQMITQARRISAARLDQRIMVPHSGDELEQLAVTFNEMLARLEGGFKQLRQFSAAASHELRTPLTVMKGELEVALRRPRDSEEYRRVLQTHLQTIDEMSQTVEELLMLARSEAVEGVLEWREMDLGELAQHITKAWQTLAETKAIHLEVQTDGPTWVRGERRLLERIIANLLDNAIRHTPPNGSVTVRAQPRNREACLVVQDTGPGIPAHELSHIFDRFFKPRSATESAQSTGLGLGLCRWIAEVHHGRIEAVSSPGQGTVLTVFLPLIPLPSAA